MKLNCNVILRCVPLYLRLPDVYQLVTGKTTAFRLI